MYTAGLQCAGNPDLRNEWRTDLEQTRQHVKTVERVCKKLEIDAEEDTPGRKVVHELGTTLVSTIQAAKAEADPLGAQTIACECVTLAETQNFADWELIGMCAKALDGLEQSTLLEAFGELEDGEDDYRYPPPSARKPQSPQGFGASR